MVRPLHTHYMSVNINRVRPYTLRGFTYRWQKSIYCLRYKIYNWLGVLQCEPEPLGYSLYAKHTFWENLMDVMDSAFSIHNLYGILSSKVQMHNEYLS